MLLSEGAQFDLARHRVFVKMLQQTDRKTRHMAKTIAVGIIGLERVGASVGLALKRYNAEKNAAQQFTITGYDTDSGTLDSARKAGAVDRAARNATDAAANQDIVVLALPYGEGQGAYNAIAGALRPGAVVLDCAPLKVPALEWAKVIPSGAFALGVLPIVNPKYLFDGRDSVEFAAADLFDKGAWLIAPGASAAGDAIELASDFAGLIGASTLFVDPVEVDAWITAVDLLPALIGFASFYSLAGSDAWKDAQRAGGAAFGRLTHHLYDTHPDDLRDMLLANRTAMTLHLDRLIDTLSSLRNALARGDRSALEAALIGASDEYNGWINRRVKGQWDALPSADQPSRSDMIMSGLFGSAIAKRIKRGDKKDGT
jgi:prephenate dehydrogenase